MKTKRDLRDEGSSSSSSSSFMAPPSAAKGKKMWDGDVVHHHQQDAGMDELLAVLGYNVRSADMVDVAHKLEQLEMVMVSAQEDGISHLSSGTVHYNPSDLSGWVQSMLTELNPLSSSHDQTPIHDPLLPPAAESSTLNFSPSSSSPHQSQIYNDDSEYDLSAIPGVSLYPRPEQHRRDGHGDGEKSSKRMKTAAASSSSSSSSQLQVPGNAESTRPVVVVDSQETGVRLVHALLACGEAVQQENLKLADALLKHIDVLAASQAGAMGKVATYFAQALARRIYRIYPQNPLESSYSDVLQMHFYEAYPYLKFAHFTANQAILEAFAGASRVHVIDFGLKQGMQWPALMQALALRPGGPPAFRLTGIGPPQPNNNDALQQVGLRLAQFAETIGVEFEFRGFMANSLADLDPLILQMRPAEVEAVAVNSVLELHRLLGRAGAIEKVLGSVRAMKPKIVTVVEQEANHNGGVFVERFTEALHYYSNMFDSLEGCAAASSQDLVMSERYLGWQICNVVACEGAERVERHETLNQWRGRMGSAGFEPVHLGSNAFRQASMLLAVFAGGDGYRVEENNGCLMLGWHTRPLIATSAWQLSTNSSQSQSQSQFQSQSQSQSHSHSHSQQQQHHHHHHHHNHHRR